MPAESVGHRPEAVRSVVVLVAYQAVLTNGFVAFAAAPPPSAAFPYQDLAPRCLSRVGSGGCVFGHVEHGHRLVGWLTFALLVTHSVVGGTLMVSNL